MNDVETNVRVARIFDEAAALVREKNPRYGSSWRDQGWRGNLSRILEKAGRLRSMLWRRDPELLSASSEHPRQTMLDMINTLAFAIINMDDGLEYGNEQPRVNANNLVPPPPADGWKTAPHGQLPGQPWPEGSGEQTLADGIPVPGEEPLGADEVAHVNKPSPTPRAAVQDRGSGPRKRQPAAK